MVQTEDFVTELKSNAVFQMSLSSKELFHSNFLAWLAENEETRPIFNHVMQECFQMKGFAYREEEMMVMREYNHFDFCICSRITCTEIDPLSKKAYSYDIPGRLIFVLENKFKSLPNARQLENYSVRAESLNLEGWRSYVKNEVGWNQERLRRGKGARFTSQWQKKYKDIIDKKKKEDADLGVAGTTYYLLTLVPASFPLPYPWKEATYAKFIGLLGDYVKSEDRFCCEMIRQYVRFVGKLTEHINVCLEEGKKENAWRILTDYKEFFQIRCGDIWQKAVMNQVTQELLDELSEYSSFTTIDAKEYNDTRVKLNEADSPTPLLHIAPGFSHGQGLVQVLYPIDNEDSFMLQQQGDLPLRVGVIIEATEGRQDKLWKNYRKLLHEKFGVGKLDEDGLLEDGYSFSKRKKNAYRYYYLDKGLSISETITQMSEMIRTVVTHTQDWKIEK